MSVFLAVLVVVGFAGLLHVFRLPDYAREVSKRGRQCVAVVRDGSMDDRAKEEALQRQARRLCVLLGILGGGSVLALGLPLGFMWLLVRGGIASFEHVWTTLERLDFLLGTVLVGGLGYVVFLYIRDR